MTPQTSIKLAVDTAPFQHRFLTVILCVFLVLVERGLAQWGLFFDSAPLISFLVVAYLGLFFPALMPIGSVFLIGLFCDFLSLDPFGMRSFSLTVFYVFIRWQSEPLREEDFITIWAQISLLFMVLSGARLVIYFALNWSLPDVLSLSYQTGMTILIFPIVFVAGSFISTLLQRNLQT